MVKSKISTRIKALFVFCFLFILFAILGATGEQRDASRQMREIWWMVFFALNLSYLLFKYSYTCNIIKITKDTISYKNMLTRRVTTYQFSELDGFVNDLYAKNIHIYLVKEGKLFGRFSKENYNNFFELAEALKPLKYLGQRPHTWWGGFKNIVW